MKLVKIRFTAWRDQPPPRRSPVFQQQLDAWTTRLSVLFDAAARISDRQAVADSEALQKQVAAISAEVQKIDTERTSLLAAEAAAADAATRKARKHEKVGTFGYQVLNEEGIHVEKIVDEAGNDVPAKAVYSCEVVDHHPPLPAWSKKGKIWH